MKFTSLTVLAATVGQGYAFFVPAARQMTALQSQKLSDIDLMAIENVAELCLNVESMVEECDLDEHEALVNQLSEQRDILQQEKSKLEEHSRYLDDILARLQGHEVDGHSLNENEIMYDQ